MRAAEEGRTPTEDIGEVEERKSDLESVKGALELVEGESEKELFTNHQQRSKYSPRFHDASVSCSPDPSTILSIVSFSHSIAFSAHPSTGIKLSWERVVVVVVVVDRAGNQSFRLSPLFFDISPPFPRPSQTATRDFPSPFPLRLRRERFLYAAAALYSQEAREGGYGKVSIFPFQDLSTSSSSTEVGGGLRTEGRKSEGAPHSTSIPLPSHHREEEEEEEERIAGGGRDRASLSSSSSEVRTSPPLSAKEERRREERERGHPSAEKSWRGGSAG